MTFKVPSNPRHSTILCLPDATMDKITHHTVPSCSLLLSSLPFKKNNYKSNQNQKRFHQLSDLSKCSLLRKLVLLPLCHISHKSEIPCPWYFPSCICAHSLTCHICRITVDTCLTYLLLCTSLSIHRHTQRHRCFHGH